MTNNSRRLEENQKAKNKKEKSMRRQHSGELLSLLLWGLLMAPALLGQDASTGIAGQLPLSACVYNSQGQPLPGQPVWWWVYVINYSGGHNHDDGARPQGQLSVTSGYTDSQGCHYTTFIAPQHPTQVAGMHDVVAQSGAFSDTARVAVMVNNPNGLQYLPNYADYQKVGTQPEHSVPDAFWGTFNVVYRIQQIASAFRQQTGKIAGINDMSLFWGGRFDLGPRYGFSFWNPQHFEHMYGLNVDCPYQYLDPNRETFLSIANEHGGGDGGGVGQEANHYHLRFAY